MAMNENQLQVQIDQINKKLDRIMESIEMQDRRREAFDDLLEDVNIVAKDAFQQSVTILDKAGVELDSCGLSCLIVKILQNIETFREMLELMESARDFMKDVAPIIQQAGLDTIRKLHELDQKGYFKYLQALLSLMDKWVQTFTPEDLMKIENNLENIGGILRNLTDPKLLASINSATKVLAETKMDEHLDNKSLWKIFLQLKTPEVRRSISYSLRLLQALNTRNPNLPEN